MPRTANTQMRKLEIIRLLSSESSPDRPLKSSSILRLLEKQGIFVTRATLKSDIEALQKCGFDIKNVSNASGKYYYLDACHMPGKETKERVKEAVRSKTQLCVSILGVPGEYLVSPYAVFRDGSGYHAACYSPAHRRVVLIPFAKLVTVSQTKVPVLPPPPDYSSLYYTARGFELRYSACETLTLSFPGEALGDVRRYFGDNVQARRDAAGLMRAEVSAEVGEALFVWLFRLGERVRVVSPEYVCREYKNNLRARLAANG